MCLDDFLGRKIKFLHLQLQHLKVRSTGIFLRLFFLPTGLTVPNSKAICNSDLLTPRLTLYMWCFPFLWWTRRKDTEFAGFKGGWVVAVWAKRASSIWFGLAIHSQRGCGFFKWRAGYGPVFDYFFSYSLLLSKMTRTRYLFTAVPALSCQWYFTCRFMWSRSIYIYIFLLGAWNKQFRSVQARDLVVARTTHSYTLGI